MTAEVSAAFYVLCEVTFEMHLMTESASTYCYIALFQLAVTPTTAKDPELEMGLGSIHNLDRVTAGSDRIEMSTTEDFDGYLELESND